MKNVYYVGSGELTFELIERIINENLKLELLIDFVQQFFFFGAGKAFQFIGFGLQFGNELLILRTDDRHYGRSPPGQPQCRNRCLRGNDVGPLCCVGSLDECAH